MGQLLSELLAIAGQIAGAAFLMCLRCVGVDENGPGGDCFRYLDYVPLESRATCGRRFRSWGHGVGVERGRISH